MRKALIIMLGSLFTVGCMMVIVDRAIYKSAAVLVGDIRAVECSSLLALGRVKEFGEITAELSKRDLELIRSEGVIVTVTGKGAGSFDVDFVEKGGVRITFLCTCEPSQCRIKE